MSEPKPRGLLPENINYRRAAVLANKIMAEIAGQTFDEERLTEALEAMSDENAKKYYETMTALDKDIANMNLSKK